MIFCILLYSIVFGIIIALCLAVLAIVIFFKALICLIYLYRFCCGDREIGRTKEGNKTIIYIDANYDERLMNELNDYCEVFNICGKNLIAYILFCGILPYYSIHESFKNLLRK